MAEENLVIHRLFSQVASGLSDKVALQIKKDGRLLKITYKDLEASSLSAAAFLIKEGFKKGDFAVLILENRPEWPIIYLGIMYAGLTCVPLDPQLNEQEIENLINDCGAKIVFVSFGIFLEKNIRRLRQRINKIVILDSGIVEEENILDFSQINIALPENIAWPEVLPRDIASLVYTSGTTARPKGVLLSHFNFCSNSRSIEILKLVVPSDNFLSILPLYHTYAFMVTLLVPLLTGARITYCASFKPEELTQTIKEADVTILAGVPQLFSLIHKAIFDKFKKIPFFLRPFILPIIKTKVKRHFGRSLRLLVSGGARLEPRVGGDLFKLGLKVIEGYGLTETAPVVTFSPPKRIKFGSVGRPIVDVEVRIHQPDKAGVGEVLIKGPNVMEGYFRQPELTSQVIKEGWFYSGDLGFMDSEGYLFLVGRKKDVIVLSSGKNIYPEELEGYYSLSPYIKEICILGKTEEKFGRMQDSLCAVIVPDLEYFQRKNEKNIQGKIHWELENLTKNLPSYKHIMGFTIIKEELPRTRLKKIKRYEVSQKYLKERPLPAQVKEAVFSEQDLKIFNTDTAKKIINYLSSQLNRPIYLDSHLEIDLGIDSLSRVELSLGLEAFLSIKIPDNFIGSVSTIREVIMGIQDIINKPATKIYASGEKQKTWNEILKEPPCEANLKKIKIDSGLLDKILTFIFQYIFLFIFRAFWFLSIEGKEFIPSRGPYILCPNHASYLDGFIVFGSLPFRSAIKVFLIGHAAIFEHPLVSWATKLGRLISIDPSTYLTEAMQAASYVLRHKKILCIFPEGGRSVSERIGEFRKGIGILVKELGARAIPVYIKGSHYSWPRGNKFPRFHPIKIIFGRPFDSEELKKEGFKLGAKDDYEAVTLGIRQEVIKLSV